MIEGLNKSLFEVRSDVEVYSLSLCYILATDIEDVKDTINNLTYGGYSHSPEDFQIQEVSVPVFNSK
jgi:hypothetical protein